MFNPSTLKRGELDKIINEEIAKCTAECGKKLVRVVEWVINLDETKSIVDVALFDLNVISIKDVKWYIKERTLVSVDAHYDSGTSY